MESEAPSPSVASSENPSNDRRPGRRRRIPRVATAIILLCTIGIIYFQLQAMAMDFAIANVFSLLLVFVILLTIVIHMLLRRDRSWLARLAPLLVLVLAVGVASRLFKVQRVTGRLIPHLTLRWAPAPDKLLPMPAIESDGTTADLKTTTPADFPGFLGPQRNLRVTGVHLQTDWQTTPPELMWRQPIGAGWSGFSAVNGFAVTMEQRGKHELVSCCEVLTGKLCWVHAIEARHETVLGGVGPRCTPTIANGRVYALGATGVLRCLDGATGTLVWSDDILKRYGVTPQQDLKAVGWGRSASPLVVDDRVIVPFGGPQGGPYASLAAYDAATGEFMWKNGNRQVSYASPTITTLCGMRQILIVNEDNVSGHAVDDGHLLWSFPWPGASAANASVSQAVVVTDDRVLLSKGYGGGAMLLQLTRSNDGPIDSEALWKNRRVLKTKFTNVVVNDHFVYGLSDGILECVDVETGKSQWKDRAADLGHGQILLVDDILLAQAENGEVVMIDPQPDGYHELGRIEGLSDQTWNNLCVYWPYLLVRNATEAACYKLPVAAASDLTSTALADRDHD